MRKLLFALAVVALAGCYAAPQDENETTTSSASSSSTTTSTTTTNGPTSQGNGGNTNGQANISTTSAGNGSTNGDTIGGGTTGSVCSCNVDSDCNDANHQGFVCVSNVCQFSGDAMGTTGGSDSCAHSNTIGTSGTTGQSCACASDADCNPQYTCQSGVCAIDPHTTGTAGGPACGTNTGTVGTTGTMGTTGASCFCNSDADCNDAYHVGYVCTDNTCHIGPDAAAATSGGGACASPTTTNTTGTSGTTGSTVCACATDADCNDDFHQGMICSNGVCEYGPNNGAVSSTGGACAHESNSSTTGGGDACSSQNDCGSGYVCTTGACEPGGGGTTGQGGGSTPLVLDFDGAPVAFTQASGRFDLANDARVRTDWVSAATPWLALDRDGNGRITSGAELFGSMTVLPDGRRAKNGFEALAALDDNHDGRIDAKDAAFARLRVWTDANQDRVSQPGELRTLRELGVTGIELANTVDVRCDARGNCERERAGFVFTRDGATQHGTIVDVWLANRPAEVAAR